MMAIRGNIKLFCFVLKEKKLAAQKTVIRLRPNTPNIDKDCMKYIDHDQLWAIRFHGKPVNM